MKWILWQVRNWSFDSLKDWLFGSVLPWVNFTAAKPERVALGAALGIFLAFVPLYCGVTAVVLFVLGLTKANKIMAGLVGTALKGVSMMFLDPTAREYGRQICEGDWARAHADWFAAPGVALLGLEKYHVMGGTILGLLASIPTFIIVWRLWAVQLRLRDTVAKAAAAKKAILDKKLERLKKLQANDPEPPMPLLIKVPTALWSLVTDGIPWAPYQKTLGLIPFKVKVAIVLFVLAEFVFLKPALKRGLREGLPPQLALAMGAVDPNGKPIEGGRCTFDDADFDASLLRSRVRIANLHVTDPKSPGRDVFSAKTVEMKLDLSQLARRRYVIEKVLVDSPVVAWNSQQGASGSQGGPVAQAQPQDWAKKAQDLFEKLKKQNDERKKREEEEKKKKAEEKAQGKKAEDAGKPKTAKEALDRAKGGLPGQNDDLDARPRWVVKDVQLTNFDVSLDDPNAPAPSFAFRSGMVQELAQDQRIYGKTTTSHFEGNLKAADPLHTAAPASVGGITLDFSEEPAALDAAAGALAKWSLKVNLTSLDLQKNDALFADAVPLKFEKGTATISFDGTGHGYDGDLLATPRIALKDVVARPRDPSKPIAGMDATKVADELTNACADGNVVELNDVTISGSLVAPRVDLGDSLKNLVIQGGKAYAKKQASQALDKGLDQATKKLGNKLPPALQGKTDDVKKATGGALDGIFGGSKKPDGSATPAPAGTDPKPADGGSSNPLGGLLGGDKKDDTKKDDKSGSGSSNPLGGLFGGGK